VPRIQSKQPEILRHGVKVSIVIINSTKTNWKKEEIENKRSDYSKNGGRKQRDGLTLEMVDCRCQNISPIVHLGKRKKKSKKNSVIKRSSSSLNNKKSEKEKKKTNEEEILLGFEWKQQSMIARLDGDSRWSSYKTPSQGTACTRRSTSSARADAFSSQKKRELP
jgi:hypothetical protein